MTYTRKHLESEGSISPKYNYAGSCRACGKKTVNYQVWESSDGAYEDFKYTCQSCHHVWWVDGIDS